MEQERFEGKGKRLNPTYDTLKLLLARSGNQCAFPDCTHEIYDDDGTLVAQCCHIEAAVEGGERYNPNLSQEDRRSPDNLLFLCYKHHQRTDNVKVYTVEEMRRMKKTHESRFSENPISIPPALHDHITRSILENFEDTIKVVHEIDLRTQRIEDKQDALLQTAGNVGGSERVDLWAECSTLSAVLSTGVKQGCGPADSVVRRVEVDQILSTLASEPLTEPSDKDEYKGKLQVLSGDAGMGKTLILGQVYNALRERGIPCVTLKADRILGETKALLFAEIQANGLKGDFVKALQEMVIKYGKVVVIMDQLDALSQFLSNRREPLRHYLSLARQITELEGVRVLVSCRTYDLTYDPWLNRLPAKTRISVSNLTNAEIETVLNPLKIDFENLSSGLQELISTPLHLDLYCNVVSKGSSATIRNSRDLYEEYFKINVSSAKTFHGLAPIDEQKLAEMMFGMAQEMAHSQRLFVTFTKYDLEYEKELAFAISTRLVVRFGSNIQFFHQSFFDFIFARHFVKSKGDLISFVELSDQGLFVRPLVRQVLHYLRDYDLDAYVQQVEALLTGHRFRFHIKLLVIQQLAFQTSPSVQEKDLVKCEVLGKELSDAFLESVAGIDWVDWLHSSGAFSKLVLALGLDNIPPSVNRFLYGFAKNRPELLLEHLSNLPESDQKPGYVHWVLWKLGDHFTPRYTALFNKYRSEFIQGQARHSYLLLLHGLKNADAQWMADQLLFFITSTETPIPPFGQNSARNDDYLKKEIFDDILDKDQVIGVKLGIDLIDFWVSDPIPIEDETSAGDPLVHSYRFLFTTFEDISSDDFDDVVFKEMGKGLSDLAARDPEKVWPLIKSWYHSRKIVPLTLAIAGLKGNPAAFKDQITDLLTRQNFLIEINHHDLLKYAIRELLSAAFELLLPDHRTRVEQSILVTYSHFEHFKGSAEDGSTKVYTTFGDLTHKYLSSIPDEALIQSEELKKVKAEVDRKFTKPSENTPPRPIRVMVGNPSPLDSAITTKMTSKQWLQAIDKHKDRNRASGERLDYSSGLAQELRDAIKAKPDRFYTLIERLIEDGYPDDYIYQAFQGLTDGVPDRDVLLRLVLIVIKADKLDRSIPANIWMVEKALADSNAVPVEIVSWLSSIAKDNMGGSERRTNPDYAGWMNTPEGSAMRALIRFKVSPGVQEVLMDLLSDASTQGSIAIRIAAAQHLGFFLKNDEAWNLRIYQLFVRLLNDSPEVLGHSTKHLIHFLKIDFQGLAQIIRDGRNHETCQKMVSPILCNAWFWNIEGAFPMLEAYWQAGDQAKISSLKFIARQYHDIPQAWQPMARQIFARFLDSSDKEMKGIYESAFYHFEPVDFEELHPLILEFAESNVGQGRQGSFYKYLLSCSRLYPMECLDLALHYTNHQLPSLYENDMDEAPLSVLIQVYNVLVERGADSHDRSKALDAIDDLLRHFPYRNLTKEGFASIDSY